MDGLFLISQSKRCPSCGQEKPISCFYRAKNTGDGYRCYCKDCIKAKANVPQRREYERTYWSDRRSERRKMVLRSYYRNEEHHKQKRKEYLATEQGKAIYRRQTQKRYALRKSAFVENVDIANLYRESRGLCNYCGVFVQFDSFHVDHRIPISRGGKHEKGNLVVACPHCNLSKGGKMPEDFIK